MKKNTEDRILKQSITLYNTIAEQYSDTPGRSNPRKTLREILKIVNGRVLDIGCGNGIVLKELPSEVAYIGIDVSERFIEIAKKKYPKERFMLYDGRDLPFSDNTFDWVVSIAMLHHVPPRMRENIVCEMKRVLKPGGGLCITVWNLWHRHFIKYFLKNLLQKITGKCEFHWNDIEYPWKDLQGNTIGMRYLHMFTKRELKKMFTNAGLHALSVQRLRFRSRKFDNLIIFIKK